MHSLAPRIVCALALIAMVCLDARAGHPDLPDDAAARAAIERYDTTVERAERVYEEAVLRAKRLLLAQLENSHRSVVARGDTEDADRIQRKIDRLQDELDDPRRAATRGVLYVLMRGEGAVYLNGHEMAATWVDQFNTLQIPLRLVSGDILVVRMRSADAWRAFRTGFVGPDGRTSTIQWRRVEARNAQAVTADLVAEGTAPVGTTGLVNNSMQRIWDELGIDDDGVWLRIPEPRDQWYTFAYVVP